VAPVQVREPVKAVPVVYAGGRETRGVFINTEVFNPAVELALNSADDVPKAGKLLVKL